MSSRSFIDIVVTSGSPFGPKDYVDLLTRCSACSGQKGIFCSEKRLRCCFSRENNGDGTEEPVFVYCAVRFPEEGGPAARETLPAGQAQVTPHELSAPPKESPPPLRNKTPSCSPSSMSCPQHCVAPARSSYLADGVFIQGAWKMRK